MSQFTIHTQETAPESSKPILANLKKAIGFVPGLYGVLAEAPKAVEAYDLLSKLFKATSLTTTEQHVVLLTINYENNCGYCMPAHTGLAKLDAVPDDVIEAIRNGKPIADPKLEALRRFTVQVVQKRGWVPDEDVEAFLDAALSKKILKESAQSGKASRRRSRGRAGRRSQKLEHIVPACFEDGVSPDAQPPAEFLQVGSVRRKRVSGQPALHPECVEKRLDGAATQICWRPWRKLLRHGEANRPTGILTCRHPPNEFGLSRPGC